MKKLLIPAVVALTSAAFAPAAFAAAVGNPDFPTIDSDKSGDVSYTELQVVLPDYDETEFAALDIDKNGSLSEEEFASLALPENTDISGAQDESESAS